MVPLFVRHLRSLLICASMAAASAVTASVHTVFEIQISTGNDDLREGSNVELVIAMRDGRELRKTVNNPRERFADRTSKTVSMNFAPGVRVEDINTVTLNWQPDRGGGLTRADEWEMAGLQLATLNSRGRAEPFFIARGQKFVGAGSVVLSNTLRSDGPALCTNDNQCDDGSYCNGVERCQPGSAGADARGCVANPNPICRAGQFCNEERNRCEAETVCPDRDGDGARAMHCGGDDCDDNDPKRYPGNVEIWDERNLDEDCDDNTSGVAGAAGYNQSPQICTGRDVMVLSTPHQVKECFKGTVCIPQPNGAGVCGVAPAGYTEPPRVSAPPGQQTGKPPIKLPTGLNPPGINPGKPKTKPKENGGG